MTITYPLVLPSTSAFFGVTIRQRSIVGVTPSIFTGTQQVQAFQGQWWEAEVTLTRMVRTSAAAWVAFLAKLNGQEGTFLMGDPACSTPLGSANITPGTPTVDGAGQTGNSLTIIGADAGAVEYLKAGDYIQLSSGATTRLHLVLNDVNTDSTGGATIDIWPSLRESPANGASVIVSAAKGRFRLASNDRSYDIDTAITYGITFSAIEAL